MHAFDGRSHAGRLLARSLATYHDSSDTIVLALPRGGVPVGFEIAHALSLPLDVCNVRKLGVPGREELALGAIASGGVCILDQPLIRELGLTKAMVNTVIRREGAELRRRDRLYRSGESTLLIRGKQVILVDDGLATGSTMLAAIAVVKTLLPQQVIVAVPVAPFHACDAIEREVDRLICLLVPDNFAAVGMHYRDFKQSSDEAVFELLRRNRASVTPSFEMLQEAHT